MSPAKHKSRRPPLAVGEVWQVRLPERTQLAKVELVELTAKTVVVETINDLSREGEKTAVRGRFALRDVTFVERSVIAKNVRMLGKSQCL